MQNETILQMTMNAQLAEKSIFEQAKQRLGAFRKRTRQCGPVVHLGIDIDSALAAPGRT